MAYAYWPLPAARAVFLLEDLAPTRGFNWIELPRDHDLFGDGSVVILQTPGHTPGEVSLQVRLPNRTVILTGDTCHFRVELEHATPMRGMCINEQQGIQSIRLLRMLRDTQNAQVWINHDRHDWAMMPHAPKYIE
jgi:glyoxylase-like metal-dependent hydrolase (beta-lactamase superfamily II)